VTFRSTFSQIIWLQVLAICAASLVMPVAIFLFLERTVADYQVRMLRQHEQSLYHALLPPRGGAGAALPAEVRAPYAQGVGGFAFAVLDRSGRVLISSQHAGAPLAPMPTGAQMRTFRRRFEGGSYYGASFPESFEGRPIVIQVGQNQEDPDVVMDDVLARFLPQVGGLSAILLLLLLLADIFIVRRALKPILRASELAGAISPSRIGLRLPLQSMPREIAPLIQAVNQAFDRLERGFKAQRDLTADVAHELRTPLAVLRMRVDALPDAAARARLQADIDVMSRTVSQLLTIAELENVVIDPADRADLRQACLEAVEHLAPLAVGEGKEIELTGAPGPVWVHGQPDFLFQAVRNLAENAIANTAVGGGVTVEAGADGRVRVLDRGPGVPAELREVLFQRFWRKRRDASAAGAGAGLGLSIVARIAQSHGGAVSVADRPGGGAIFTLALVTAEPDPPA
jgi:signal transduction histidine kinase